MRTIKRQRNRKRYGIWLITAVLLFVAGCQSLGGLDLNRALLNGIQTTSMQQSATVSLHIKPDPNNPPDEPTQAMIDLLNDAALVLEQIKLESPERLSVKGHLALSKGSIPFQLFADERQMIAQVDGAKQMIVFPYDPSGQDGLNGSEEMTRAFFDMRDEWMKKSKEKGLDKAIASFIVHNLPNPKSISVVSKPETIRGEQVDVYKLETTVSGTEMIPLLKTFLRNMTKDEAAFKQLVGQLYDVVWPIVEPELKRALGQQAADGEYSEYPLFPALPGGNGVVASLVDAASDRELAIDMIHTTLKELMFIAMIGVDSLDRTEDSPLREVLHDNTYVNAKLSFDRSLQLRKSEVELSVSPKGADTGGIAAVQIKLQTEAWDINKPVKADVLSPGPSPFIFDASEGGELSELVDPSSLLGQLLETQRSLRPDPVEPMSETLQIPLQDKDSPELIGAYIENGVAYAPLWLLTDNLFADMSRDGDHITVVDAVGEIGFTVGSNVADVDGDPIEMDGTVRVHGDVVYVPCLIVVQWLGAYAWVDEEAQAVSITLDWW